MSERYDHQAVEKKWQAQWKESLLYHTTEVPGKEKSYVLDMFPYPSGEGLHVGHPKGYIATDIYSRMMRMQGKAVLHPMGWDAFGLPAENYALKNKVHPRTAVEKNIATFKSQLEKIGFDYDWSREINTTDPAYYKWTQWIFVQLFTKGLAYQSNEPINWCPSCMTGLANEDLEGGLCERCGSVVEKKRLPQWVLAITTYADRLLTDLDTLTGWPEHIKESQRNWIGRSEGALINFPLSQQTLTGEIVFASNNEGKFRRMEKLCKAAGLPVVLKRPKDIGIDTFEVAEDGTTLAENSEKKARALSVLTTLPVLADDSGFFIDNEEIDPLLVKRNALNGVDEKTLTVEEVALRMQQYYKDIANKQGGRVGAEWRNNLCLITPDRKVSHIEVVRPAILTNESRGTADPYLPLRNLYISKATNKFVLEQSDEEELIELQPITEGMRALLTPSVKVFTTRPDTLFGATYMVLSPEHPLLRQDQTGQAFWDQIQNKDEVLRYIVATQTKSEIERTAEGKEKTGVELKGVTAINPAIKEAIPVWVADYVLGHYGMGAIMAVPAHDERDLEFAKKFNLPVKEIELADPKKVVADVGGSWSVEYKLRDWVFSRQRYWGEPIPIIHCPKDGAVPVPESDLPVLLPEVESYEPAGTGESPLATITEWVNTTCPVCKGPGKRETNTMPQWAGSSWYYLRYMDPHNKTAVVGKEREKFWAPVDMYVGGAEHATRHLIYARFWHKFLYDIGVVSTIEPFETLHSVGLIIAEDGRKMSKRFGNIINPDDIVAAHGADTLRVYEMFMGPFENAIAWNTQSLAGSRRFIERVWRAQEFVKAGELVSLEVPLAQTIKKVSEDVPAFKFNTAISQLMILLNAIEKEKAVGHMQWRQFLQLLAPFAPHIAEELWARAGNETSIHTSSWPTPNLLVLAHETVLVAVQVNGKVRATIALQPHAPEEEALAVARADAKVQKWLAAGETSARYVPGKIVSFTAERLS